jgi:hypothetical protein
MVSKADFKNLFQSSLKDMLTKKEKQAKKKDNLEVDDESFDMNVFEKLMEGKHTEIVSNGDDDLKSINDTNTFSYSEQNNMTDKPCLGNNYNNPSPHRFATRAPFGLGRFHEKLSEKKHSKSIFSFSQENARPTTLGLRVGSKKDPGYNQKNFHAAHPLHNNTHSTST